MFSFWSIESKKFTLVVTVPRHIKIKMGDFEASIGRFSLLWSCYIIVSCLCRFVYYLILCCVVLCRRAITLNPTLICFSFDDFFPEVKNKINLYYMRMRIPPSNFACTFSCAHVVLSGFILCCAAVLCCLSRVVVLCCVVMWLVVLSPLGSCCLS